MRNFKLTAGILVCSAAALVAGCGDDGDTDGTGASNTGATGTGGSTGGTGTGATGGNAGGAGGDGGSGGAGNMVNYEITVVDQDAAALEGAGFAMDMMDGSRVEGVSDANGIVNLAVPADVDPDMSVVHKDGYNYLAVPMALFQGNTELELSVFADPDTSGFIQVTGSGLNMADAGVSNFFVGATPGTFDGDEGVTTYDILVPPSTDFTLSSFETSFLVAGQDLTRTFENVWFSQETGIAAMATIDIDFADPDPASTPFALSVVKPDDPSLATTGLMFINTDSSNGPAGGSTTCAHDGVNGEYDCVGFSYDNGQPIEATFYIVGEDERNSGGFGRQVVAFAAGGPPSGTTDVNFVNAPDIIAPAGAGPHPVDTLVEYDVAPGGGTVNFVVATVTSPDDQRPIGTIYADQMGGLRVPELPSTSDLGTVYEASMIFDMITCRSGAGGNCAAIGSENWEVTLPAN